MKVDLQLKLWMLKAYQEGLPTLNGSPLFDFTEYKNTSHLAGIDVLDQRMKVQAHDDCRYASKRMLVFSL